MTRDYRDFIDLIASLEGTDTTRGIVLFDARLRESFHPYDEVFRRTRAIARQFVEQGIRPGHRVVIPLATDLDAICSFFALIWLGALPFSITAPMIGQDRDAHRRQVVRLVTTHGVDRLLVSDDLSGIAGAYPETPASMALVARRPTPEQIADETPVPRATVEPGDDVFVQFSSGSTAQPKGVRITHRGLLYNLGLIMANDSRTPDSVWVSWLPLYHDMGLVGGLLTNLVLKNHLVLMHPRSFITRPIVWLAAISRFRGTVTAIPNFALDICTDRITDEQLEEANLDLSSFRFIYNGSEPVRPSSIRRFEERFAEHGFVPGSVYPVYGMAETTLIISSPRRGDPLEARRVEGMDVPSVGYPLGDFEVEIRDDAGRVLGPCEVGEIHVRGTSVTPSYLDPSGATDGLIRDGWLATGDLGQLDERGRIYVTGRKKDLIILQGRNFYGHDIAICIEDHLRLKPGSVYAFSIERDGQESVVALVATPKPEGDGPGGDGVDTARMTDEIRRHVHGELGIALFDVRFVPRIPKTTSGKIVRHLCREMYLQGV